MRILWVCNVVPPMVAKQLNIDTTVKEGWIDASLRKLSEDSERDFSMGICMPRLDIDSPFKKDEIELGAKKAVAYSFLEQTQTPWVYDKTLESTFSAIIQDFKPDLIHIFGTEYPHTLACAKAFNNPSKILVGIQGVVSECAKAYCGGLPSEVVNATTFRDSLKKDNIAMQQKKFFMRAEFENEALKLVGNVTGRTEFDRKAALAVNDKLIYHPMNETLRSEFYEGQWDVKNLDKHSIFVTQADYPLKGFHDLLKAMPEVLGKYPDTKIYVAGNSITRYKTLKEKIKIGTYGSYLRKLMKKYGIEDKVEILGRLSAEQMKQRYLESSVLICNSYIENSPNSVGEAMLLGTPVIVPRTGGIPSMATEDEAVFYEVGNIKQLSDSIVKLFGDGAFAEKLSEAERIRAAANHDGDNNFKRLTEIYDRIC